jgi:PadR family transcriptional regulator, regulatory protein PadR
MKAENTEVQAMAEGEREKHGGNPRPDGTNGRVEVRPRNWLVPVTLLTLRDSTTYGYKLMKQAAAFGLGAMNPGTFYRTMRHMEKDGLCRSEWDMNSAGPARRIYTITDAGEAYLGFWAEALEQYRLSMDLFFRLYTGGGTTARRDRHEDDG